MYVFFCENMFNFVMERSRSGSAVNADPKHWADPTYDGILIGDWFIITQWCGVATKGASNLDFRMDLDPAFDLHGAKSQRFALLWLPTGENVFRPKIS